MSSETFGGSPVSRVGVARTAAGAENMGCATWKFALAVGILVSLAGYSAA